MGSGARIARAVDVVTFSHNDLMELWVRNGGNPNNADMAAAIAQAESGGDPNATNHNQGGSTDYGLWQINDYYNGGSEADFDPDTCCKHAIAQSSNGDNWRPWCTAYSDGACGTKGGTYLGDGAPYQRHLEGDDMFGDADRAQVQHVFNFLHNLDETAQALGYKSFADYLVGIKREVDAIKAKVGA